MNNTRVALQTAAEVAAQHESNLAEEPSRGTKAHERYLSVQLREPLSSVQQRATMYYLLPTVNGSQTDFWIAIYVKV